MRKLLTSIVVTLITGTLFAGGLVTNTNQSAAWVRLPSRNASTDVDAAYFNPAGLMKLENGFHFSISNQTIFQTKEVTNSYKGPGGMYGLNNSYYKGDVTAPVYPSVYAVYKMDRVAFSFGFNPIGGGGGAEYKTGLPSFEIGVSDLVPALAASKGTVGYRLKAYLKGSSVFFGFQGNVSFKINDMISVAAGLRYVTAKNTYNGYLKDIELNTWTKETPVWERADGIMTVIAAGAASAGNSTTALLGIPGAAGQTLAWAQTNGYINAVQRAQLEGALVSFGYPAGVNIGTADAVFKGAAAKYGATATILHDQSVDAEQTGSGVSPIFSVNITPSENINISVKYEMATRMQIENKTTSDFLVGFTASGTPITMFKDGELTPADMPAQLSVGLDYKMDAIKISLGSNYFFDKAADYGHKLDLDYNSATPSTPVLNKDIISKNGLSLQGGLEINLSDKLLVSGGYVWANQGVNDIYQSDLTYGLATNTFGFGGAYKVTDNLLINLGAGWTSYVSNERMVDHIFSGNNTLYQSKETYQKKTWLIGVGVDFSF